MSDNNNSKEKVIERISTEIAKLEGNGSKIYFFVMDTKGYPNSQVEYEYKLASLLKGEGYDVTMMYQERPVEQKDENGSIIVGEDGKPIKEANFVGVGSWLGEDFANLPHVNSFTENVSLTPSDILFIPEIYASVMQQTKNFPCKRIAIVTNYVQMIEALPIPEQFADYGIKDVLVPTDSLASQIKTVFPYCNTTVINPYIDDKYSDDGNIKDMTVAVLCKDKSKFIQVLSPFYWQYPMFRWVVFTELRGMSSDDYAKALKKSAITLYLDSDTTFGIGALEAMKSGSLVVGKMPDMICDWQVNKEENKLNDCGFWTDDLKSVSTVLANAVRMWTTEQVPAEVYEAEKKAVEPYTIDNTFNQLITFVKATLEDRLKELKDSLEKVQNS